MLLRKWNYDVRSYEHYEVSDEWDCRYIGFNMSKIINCCQCGNKVRFGDCYSSQEVHTDMGFGYMVCEECHEVEMKRQYEDYLSRNDKKEI